MNLLKAGVRLCGWLAICQAILAQAPHITDTKLVNSGNTQEWLRKINGRWWSQDNREVYPPSQSGFGYFWELDSKAGTCQFYHHRPFQLARAESLHLWMKKAEVEAALGPPNRTFGTDDHAWWYYYAANGIKLEIRFMDDGVLGEAKYTAIGEKSRAVASVERDMNGKDIFTLLQQRAHERSKEWLARKTEENRIDSAARSEALRSSIRSSGSGPRSRSPHPSMVAVEPVTVPRPVEPEVPAKKRIVSAEALTAVRLGTTREDLLSRLGEPSSRFAITGDEGVRESFTYDLDSGETVVIRLAEGRVVKVR